MRLPEGFEFYDQIKQQAAWAQLEIARLSAEEAGTVADRDDLSERKKDLMFFSRMLQTIDSMRDGDTDEDFDWMSLNVYITPNTQTNQSNG